MTFTRVTAAATMPGVATRLGSSERVRRAPQLNAVAPHTARGPADWRTWLQKAETAVRRDQLFGALTSRGA